MNTRLQRSLIKKLAKKFPNEHICIQHEEQYYRCTGKLHSEWSLYTASSGWKTFTTPLSLRGHINTLLST